MSDAEKTVFISYRRKVSSFIARAIFQDLRSNGYDVFMDVENIDSGTFDTIILNQIEARAHFLVILTPGTLNRCVNADDWLRKEIEHAMECERNIVPVLVNGFKFDKKVSKFLTDKLEQLPRLNGLTLPHEYFEAGMERLRERFFKKPSLGNILSIPQPEQAVVEEKIEEAAKAPAPTEIELQAEDYFVRAYEKYESGDLDSAIEDYTEAIRLNLAYFAAYNNRGLARARTGDVEGAIADYDTAVHLKPDYADAYNNRGLARAAKGDVKGAIADYDTVIRLKPDYATTYNNRGNARARTGDVEGAIADYDTAVHLKPDYAMAYSNRAEVFFTLARFDEAMEGFKKADELQPSFKCAAGLAITHHAMGNVDEGRRLWQGLAEQDSGFKDADWVKGELNWAEPLVNEARKLLAGLGDEL